MTRTDLFRKALEKLHVIAVGDDMEPEDEQTLSDKYDALWDMLRGLKLVGWGQDEDVPDYAVIPLTAMLAFAAADDFDIDPTRYAAEGALNLPTPSIAERQLRAQMARDYVSTPARSEYF